MFWRLLKTIFAVGMAIIPLSIAEIQDVQWRWISIILLTVVVASTNFFGFFRPDKRFEEVRDPTLKRFFDEKFSTVR